MGAMVCVCMYVCDLLAAISVQSLVVSRQHPVRQNLQSLVTKLYIMPLSPQRIVPTDDVWQDYGDDLLNKSSAAQPSTVTSSSSASSSSVV